MPPRLLRYTPPMSDTDNLSSALQEIRVFPPVAAAGLGFSQWHVGSIEQYRQTHRRSITDPDGFWGEQSRLIDWFSPWEKVLEWNAPDAKWFGGGTTNACYNCVDRHVKSGHADDVGLVWEGEPMDASGVPEVRRLTYRDLQRETSKLANGLVSMGVKKGDRVTIYLPMVPELVIAVLACARIGAPHSVIFGGFAPHAIVDRMTDAGSDVIITADGGYRRGQVVPLLKNVTEACETLKSQGRPVGHVLCLSRHATSEASGKDLSDAETRGRTAGAATHVHDYHALTNAQSDECPCRPMGAEDMLFLLYTSGSTGKPKGIVHTTAGYLVFAALTAKLTFNLIPGSGQLFWCTADVGWVTGHSYVIYGVMMNRVPTLIYEGAPNAPRNDRFWDIAARHKVTQLYTAPTAIRTFMKWGDEWPAKHDLSHLKLLGTVGEPINPEAWMWYHTHIGRGRCPVVDTYWQTETGGHVITPLPGAVATKPGSCTVPMYGIDAAIVNEQGQELPPNQGGLLVTRKPWPGMLRGVYNDRNRFIQSYWGRLKDPVSGEPWYFSADGARRDHDGYFWVMGRVDDVINVAGHRLGTMEVESALVSHPAVAEAAVVGMPHEIKGTGICAFVTLKHAAGRAPDDALKQELGAHVTNEIGALARPDVIRFTDGLPKTRSGKIMRRLLRDVAAGVEKIEQDTTTLEDFSVIAKLRAADHE